MNRRKFLSYVGTGCCGLILNCLLSVIGAVAHEFRINPQQPLPTYDKNFLLFI